MFSAAPVLFRRRLDHRLEEVAPLLAPQVAAFAVLGVHPWYDTACKVIYVINSGPDPLVPRFQQPCQLATRKLRSHIGAPREDVQESGVRVRRRAGGKTVGLSNQQYSVARRKCKASVARVRHHHAHKS